mmetsp:Transcript_21948/g.53838  ORF Transcript_21948/g.53838 Transcript_21948/m.53838 type:complete len:218 (-) Transcript_21948:468-1121(-)
MSRDSWPPSVTLPSSAGMFIVWWDVVMSSPWKEGALSLLLVGLSPPPQPRYSRALCAPLTPTPPAAAAEGTMLNAANGEVGCCCCCWDARALVPMRMRRTSSSSRLSALLTYIMAMAKMNMRTKTTSSTVTAWEGRDRALVKSAEWKKQTTAQSTSSTPNTFCSVDMGMGVWPSAGSLPALMAHMVARNSGMKTTNTRAVMNPEGEMGGFQPRNILS